MNIIERELVAGSYEDPSSEYNDACYKLDVIVKNFNEDTDKTWQDLMEIEISLFERAEVRI